jgi:hypothetical protein
MKGVINHMKNQVENKKTASNKQKEVNKPLEENVQEQTQNQEVSVENEVTNTNVEASTEVTEPSVESVEQVNDKKNQDENQEDESDINEKKNPMLKDSEKKVAVPFERKTRIQKSSVNRTIKSLYKDWKKGFLRFDLAIQRNDVWTNEQKSMLIHSLLYGFPIPPVYVQESDDDFIWFLDGRQRIGATLMPFINGDWALSKNTPDIFGHKIAGCKFKDLPEDIQDTILDEPIQLVKMKNMTDEERDEMFVRLNSGSTLSRIELTRAMHSELIEKINHISELNFFAKDIALTSKARNRFVDQEIILQIAMLMEEGIDNLKGFGSSHIKDFVLRLKESEKTLSDELMKKFEEIASYLSHAVVDFEPADLKKALKKIHVPIIFYVAQKAIEDKISPVLFGDFIRSFLVTNYSVESDYGVSCQAGSSKKENVMVRLREMSRAFEKFEAMLKQAGNAMEAVNAFENELYQEIKKQEEQNKSRANQQASESDEDTEE